MRALILPLMLVLAPRAADALTREQALEVLKTLDQREKCGDYKALAYLELKERDKSDTVQEAQRARHLRMPVAVHAGFMPSVFRWAAGEDDWSGIVEESFGGHEGDLIRAFRRLIDLSRQLAESPELPPDLTHVLRDAVRMLDRGIVLESALI